MRSIANNGRNGYKNRRQPLRIANINEAYTKNRNTIFLFLIYYMSCVLLCCRYISNSERNRNFCVLLLLLLLLRLLFFFFFFFAVVFFRLFRWLGLGQTNYILAYTHKCCFRYWFHWCSSDSKRLSLWSSKVINTAEAIVHTRCEYFVCSP